MSSSSVLAGGSLLAGDVRAYVAPVDRTTGLPVAFDPESMGRFDLSAPPIGWMGVGTVASLKRDVGESWKPVWSGAPATIQSQGRARVEETIEVVLPAWTRLAVALSSGMQTMNLLRATNGAAVPAEVVGNASTATVLHLPATTSVAAGDVLVVDVDYAGETGYMGSGVAGTYVATTPANPDVDFVRRVSFNVARVLSVNTGVVTLASALPAGVPNEGMKASVVEGFVDRNGGSFLQEWSALFVMDGFQGDRMLLHYPRLQPMGKGAAETSTEIAKGVTRWRPVAKLRALPVTDAVDGVRAVCFRSYLPAAMRQV